MLHARGSVPNSLNALGDSRSVIARAGLTLAFLTCAATLLGAQATTAITGQIRDGATGNSIPSADVSVDGTAIHARADSAGRFRLTRVPPGPQALAVRALGYAPARIPVIVPPFGTVQRDVQLARVALKMPEVQVTAEGIGRARGELGTATVINRDAIQNQSAASLAGVLELIPGMPLQPPGLDAVQQVALRAVPTTSGAAERAAAFGTLIVMDGVPLSNDANLQTVGPRGEIVPPTSAGGSIDLRRIPATTLERVEVIRGIPSARYGDLTTGAIIVDTRAGAFPAQAIARFDPNTTGISFAGGQALSARQVGSLTTDITRTNIAPGVRDASVWRGTVDLAHRVSLGGDAEGNDALRVFDSRINIYQVYQNEPEQPDLRPGVVNFDRSGGVRVSERIRLGRSSAPHAEFTGSVENEWQDSFAQRLLIRGAEPFTDRLTPGTSVGHFVDGAYAAALRLVGKPWHLYARAEQIMPAAAWGGERTIRIGVEARRDWNDGPGYEFDIENPPQVTFNGVNGYDRPRRFDTIAPVATSAAYADLRFVRALSADASFEMQAGLRVDVLHTGTWWTSGAREAQPQPRLNVQFAPRSWMRLRAGWGTTVKPPALSDLAPAPQYYDVVNVNWYAPNPAERLAVLTTSIVDPTNRKLGLSLAEKSEVSIEIDLGRSGAALSLVAFREVTRGAVGYDTKTSFLLRDHYALSGAVIGSGHPPTYTQTPTSTDTVPIFTDVPSNLNRIENRGVEWTLALPEIAPLRTRIELTGAWTVSRLHNDALDIGVPTRVTDFQMDTLKPRIPYWTGDSERGERALTTARIVHHQPELGLVVTATVQYFLRENRVQEGALDTLAWDGYITRTGTLVAVPLSARGAAQYADLRQPRQGVNAIPTSPAPDWLLSLQVTKSIFGTGRLSFYAFNALDRLGQAAVDVRAARIFAPSRFGLEVTLPLDRSWSEK